MKGIRDTSNETFRQLMGNGLTYQVPKFQRDYSWDIEQWEDLWQDIEVIYSGEESAHYLGYLVLQTQDDKSFKIIDGQQRLTTLSILILAVLKNLEIFEKDGPESVENKQRRETFHSSYIGYLNPVSLVSENKLKLNRNNDNLYKTYLTTLQPLPKRGLTASEKLMRKCFENYETWLGKKYKTGKAIAEFLDDIVDKLFFTVIKVSDDLNAFRVFETLNARGVPLSTADLLKNYLFSVIDSLGSHSNEIQTLEEMWIKITSKLGYEKFSDFLRQYWNSRHKAVRKSDLFKKIRQEIQNKEQAFQLIRDLDYNADTYIALQNPEDEFWQELPKVKEQLEGLKLYRVKQPLSLLLIAYQKYTHSDFLKILRACTISTFRYNIISGSNPKVQETTYNKIALRIIKGEAIKNLDFSEIYPLDDTFEANFANKSFKDTAPNHQIIRHIFSEIISQFYEERIDGFNKKFTIEHIFPQHADDKNWGQFSNAIQENYVYRLGNLTLLEKTLNQEAANKNFQEKLAIYKRSKLKINQELAEIYDTWDEASIVKRQKWLAKQAKTIWRLEM